MVKRWRERRDARMVGGSVFLSQYFLAILKISSNSLVLDLSTSRLLLVRGLQFWGFKPKLFIPFLSLFWYSLWPGLFPTGFSYRYYYSFTSLLVSEIIILVLVNRSCGSTLIVPCTSELAKVSTKYIHESWWVASE